MVAWVVVLAIVCEEGNFSMAEHLVSVNSNQGLPGGPDWHSYRTVRHDVSLPRDRLSCAAPSAVILLIALTLLWYIVVDPVVFVLRAAFLLMWVSMGECSHAVAI